MTSAAVNGTNLYYDEHMARCRIPGARMVVGPGVGHLVYFEKPSTFNRVAPEFLADAR